MGAYPGVANAVVAVARRESQSGCYQPPHFTETTNLAHFPLIPIASRTAPSRSFLRLRPNYDASPRIFLVGPLGLARIVRQRMNKKKAGACPLPIRVLAPIRVGRRDWAPGPGLGRAHVVDRTTAG